MYKHLAKIGFALFLGLILGFISLHFHPQFSYYGVEFLRAQSPQNLSVLDYPHPYSLLTQERNQQAPLYTQFHLKKKSVTRWDIHRLHGSQILSFIRENPKIWIRHCLQKLGLFFGCVEFNNPILLFQNNLISYFIGFLSICSLISLLFLISHRFIQLSIGLLLSYFIFYSTSSLRLFLVPLYLILTFLLIRKIMAMIMRRKYFQGVALVAVIALSVGVARIPFFIPFEYSEKNLKRIHHANGFFIKGKKWVEQNKKYLALNEFLQGLKIWSYHSSIRVEIAKIRLSNQELEEALNMLRNPRDNPFAHEVLAQIFTQYAKTYHDKDLSKKAHERAKENLKKAKELMPFEPRFSY